MLGCLIYELCFLKRPFDGESISMIMIQIINTNPALNTEIHKYSYSSELISLITQCLSKDPAERPSINKIYLAVQKRIKSFKAVDAKDQERDVVIDYTADFNQSNVHNNHYNANRKSNKKKYN